MPMDLYSSSDSGVVSNIRAAGKERKTLMIKYKGKGGEITERETEPYEIKDGAYWGYDTAAGSIKRFTLTNILQAQITDDTFIPQWPVKF